MSKLSNSPSSSNSPTSKNFRLVAPGNLDSDGPGAEVNVVPLSITSHDVNNAASQLLGTPSSFDQAKAQIPETENQVKQVLIAKLDEELDPMTKRSLWLSTAVMEHSRYLLDRRRRHLAKAQIIYQYEVFETLLKALNNIIFNPDPTSEERKHRGSGILTKQDVETLQKKRQMNITDIIRWKPKPANAKLKEKALSCLTQQQRRLARVLITPAIRNLNRSQLYCIEQPFLPPRTSQAFAKATVEKVFNDLNLGSEYPGLSVSDFNDLIENAPSPLVGDDPRPLFLVEDEDVDSPDRILEEMARREQEIHDIRELIVTVILPAKFVSSYVTFLDTLF